MSVRPKQQSPLFIRTKLSPPRLSRKVVLREAPIQSIAVGATRALTLVKAPAGFGKTTLLTEWRESLLGESQIVAWLTLDRDDNDVNHFIEYLTKTLAEALGDLVKDMPELRIAGKVVSARVVLTSLINSLDKIDREVTLILDDYDKITEPAVHDLFAFLLQHIPSNLHVMVASRSEPPLPLSYLRARDQMVEIDAGAMRFGIDDTRAFFAPLASVKLSASETRAIHDATEGWVTGLQIVAIVLRSHSSPKDLIAGFSGQHRALSDYLAENVLARIAPDTVAFMLRTSILERLSGDLCERVAGSAEGQSRLEWLAAQNLFLQGLDDERKWYRYHGLFADFLRAQLERQLGDELPMLHWRAAEWFSEQGLWAEAVRHALAANRVDIATEWVERCAMREVEDSRLHSLLSWMHKLPQEAVRQRPRLRMAFAWALALTIRLAEAQSIVEDIERQLDEGVLPETDGMRYELLALRLAILVIQDDTAAALELDSVCLERVSRQKRAAECDTWKDEAVLNCLIYCYEKAGNLEKARSIEHLHPPAANLFTISYRASVLSACDIREGHLRDGARRLREALSECEKQAGRRSGAASLVAGSLAKVHYEWNDLDTVEELLADRLDVIEDVCYVDAVQSAYISLARIWIVRGDFQAAHDLFDRAEVVGNRRSWLRLLAACAAERTRLWLLDNRLVDAERSATQLELIAKTQTANAHGENSDIVNLLHLTRARLLLHKHCFSEAVVLLKKDLGNKEAASNQYAMAKFSVLLAIAHDGAGDQAAALACLSEVLKFGESANLVRLIADEKEGVNRLIESLPPSCKTSSQHSDYRGRLWRALGLDLSKGTTSVLPTTSGVSETLSKREQDILGLVTKGLANKQIARTLLITPETVKWHLKNVYSKLGVSGRTLAAHRARQMELIRE